MTYESKLNKLLAGLLAFALVCRAEIITTDRRYDWQGNAGVSGGIPASSGKTVYQTVSAGASVATVQGHLDSCPANQVVVMGAGAYSWASRIDWSGVANGVVLRGAVDGNGAPTTVITWSTFSLAGMLMRCSAVDSTKLDTDANLSADATKGGTTLTLASVPSWVTVGDLIGVDELDETSFVSSTGTEGGSSYREIEGNGQRGLGMLNRVTAKNATTITVEMPLNYGYKTAQTAQIFQPAFDPSAVNPLIGCGLENLKMVCSFSSSGAQTVRFQCADSCYIKNCEFDNAADTPIFADFSYRCEVRHCNLHDTHLTGSGQGYATALYHICTGWLIEDNIIRNFHNGMTANYGSTCNVWAYNYESGGTSGSGQNPAINTHGVHCYLNLWEGNQVADKVLADWTHGSSSHNTVFRNVITGGSNVSEDSQSCVSVEYFNRYWNIVGNILGTNGALGQNKYLTSVASTGHGSQGSIFLIGGEVNINEDFSPSDAVSYTTGSFILVHGNWDYVQDAITYDSNIADHALLSSLVYATRPAIFTNTGLTWPPYDPASPGSNTKELIPSGYRYTNGFDPTGTDPGGGGAPASGVGGTATVGGKATRL